MVDKVAELPAGQGLNSANGEWGDMIEMGVLDPVKVSRVTLQNAASVASLILITEATVSDVPRILSLRTLSLLPPLVSRAAVCTKADKV